MWKSKQPEPAVETASMTITVYKREKFPNSREVGVIFEFDSEANRDIFLSNFDDRDMIRHSADAGMMGTMTLHHPNFTTSSTNPNILCLCAYSAARGELAFAMTSKCSSMLRKMIPDFEKKLELSTYWAVGASWCMLWEGGGMMGDAKTFSVPLPSLKKKPSFYFEVGGKIDSQEKIQLDATVPLPVAGPQEPTVGQGLS